MRSITAWSRRGWPVSLFTKTGIGTPQARWREMHQSGRPSTMDSMRLRPADGTQRVASMAERAVSRRPVFDMEMNHCAVLRKMRGAFERQEWG